MKARPYETCDLMHNGVCVSSPCICKSVYIAERKGKKTEPIDQATKHECEFFLCQDDRAYLCECGRIEFNHETFYPESEITSLREKLKQERNKVIDECIDYFGEHYSEMGDDGSYITWTTFDVQKKLESLKRQKS